MQKIKPIATGTFVATMFFLLSPVALADMAAIGIVKEYEQLLINEPNNCVYYGILGRAYQQLNEFNKSIARFERAISICPNDVLDTFDLGVSYLLIKNKDKGIYYMDRAIEMAREKGDAKAVTMLDDSKKVWLKRWSTIKTLPWNNR